MENNNSNMGNNSNNENNSNFENNNSGSENNNITPQPTQYGNPDMMDTMPRTAPVIHGDSSWATFWLGIVTSLVLGVLTSFDLGIVIDLVFLIVLLIFDIFSIVYAAVFYPSYFSFIPKLNSSQLIAFFNGFCGGIIFGLCWQFNLKKNVKGVSHIVYIVLFAVAFVFSVGAVILALGFLMV